MKYLVAVDDTDMPDTKGTGWLVQELCEKIENRNWGSCSPVSRHQLFVHKDIAFTSHNSSMCFKLDLTGCSKSSFLEFITAFLEKRSAKGSDPGLCMAKLNDQLQNEKLIEFGLKAKSHVLCKSEAYNLAKETEIHLSEHGGTGIGVIGALAGIGLRLTGNDGRYRGWYHFGKPGDIVTAGSLYAYNCVDQVVTKSGRLLGTDEFLMIGSEKTKTIRMRHNQVVLACANENSAVNRGARYRTLTKDEAKAY